MGRRGIERNVRSRAPTKVAGVCFSFEKMRRRTRPCCQVKKFGRRFNRCQRPKKKKKKPVASPLKARTFGHRIPHRPAAYTFSLSASYSEICQSLLLLLLFPQWHFIYLWFVCACVPIHGLSFFCICYNPCFVGEGAISLVPGLTCGCDNETVTCSAIAS